MLYDAQELAKHIKNRAKERNVLLKEVLEVCELNINTISQISSKKGLSCFSLAKIADQLDCSVDYLLGRTDNPAVNRSCSDNKTPQHTTYANDTDQIIPIVRESSIYEADKHKIAVLGRVAAGTPILTLEVDYGMIVPQNPHSTFALIAQGSSMEPVIQDKEFIEVIKQAHLEQGEIGIIYVNGEATCKKFYNFEDHYELRSINPEYDTMTIEKTPSTTLLIMGKVSLSAKQQERLDTLFY